MNEFDGIIDLLRNDGSIIVNKNLAFEIGLENAIVYIELLSKYRYFKKENDLTKDGYFYNTIDNFRLDTTLTGKRQRRAIKKLEKIGLIKTDLRGLPPTRHFKPNEDTQKILKLINKGKKNREKLEEKLAEKADKSKKRYMGRFKSTKVEKTNTPNQSVNNTKVNNTKDNTNTPYIEPKKSSVAMSIFLRQYENMTGEKHKAVKEDIYYRVEELMNDISYQVEEHIIEQQLYKYFDEFDYSEGDYPTLYYFDKVAGRYFFEHCREVFHDRAFN